MAVLAGPMSRPRPLPTVEDVDPILVSRLLFACTSGLHFLFVATTLGLAPVIAVLNTVVAARPSPTNEALLAVLGRVYLANYGIGIVTGLVMELQMAVLWTGPGAADYDPIAAMLALETVVAFFLESTLLGLWVAGAGLLPAWLRAVVFWGVTATAYASATVIMGANSQLHLPVDVGPGALGLDDVAALVLRPASTTPLLHVATSSLVVGGFWLATVAVRLLARGDDPAVARRALRIGVLVVSAAIPFVVATGFAQFGVVREHLVTEDGSAFGLALALMMLVGSLIMLGTWFVMVPVVFAGVVERRRWTWPVLSGGVAIPLATTFLGWLYREESRQPWFIVGRVPVTEAASPLPLPTLLAMSIGFFALGAVAAVLGWRLMRRSMRVSAPPVEQAAPVSGRPVPGRAS